MYILFHPSYLKNTYNKDPFLFSTGSLLLICLSVFPKLNPALVKVLKAFTTNPLTIVYLLKVFT